MSYECPRCTSDNTQWEKVRHTDPLASLGNMGLLWLIPGTVSVAQILLGLYFGASDRRMAYFTFLMVVVCLFANAIIGMVTFAWRFRIREYSHLVPVIPRVRLPSHITLMLVVPVLVLSLAFIAIIAQDILIRILANQPIGLRDVMVIVYRNLVQPTSDVEMILTYVFLSGVCFSAALFAVRRYVDSLDLPSPIFVNVPLLRVVALKEFFGGGSNTVPRDIEYKEMNRTSRGGLAMTVSWKAGEKPTKDSSGKTTLEPNVKTVKIECDRWARITSAQEQVPTRD